MKTKMPVALVSALMIGALSTGARAEVSKSDQAGAPPAKIEQPAAAATSPKAVAEPRAAGQASGVATTLSGKVSTVAITKKTFQVEPDAKGATETFHYDGRTLFTDAAGKRVKPAALRGSRVTVEASKLGPNGHQVATRVTVATQGAGATSTKPDVVKSEASHDGSSGSIHTQTSSKEKTH